MPERAAQPLSRLEATDLPVGRRRPGLPGGLPERPAWQIGIEDPADPTRILAQV
ncbi:MAG: hypothetical protein R2734_07440 [Nocardioides sp.]